MYRIIVLIVFSLFLTTTYGQFQITHDPKDRELFIQLTDKIYNLEFVEAESLLNVVKHKFPNHPSYHLLKAMAIYWEMTLISRDHPRFDEYTHHLEMVVKLSEPLLNNPLTNPEACFFLMGAHSSLTLVNSKSKDYMAALSEARLAYKFMKEGFKLKEKYPDFHFSTGLYNFYVVQYPETHPMIKPFMWFFPPGNKQYGIREMELGSKVGVFSQTEALYFSSHVQLKYENKPEIALAFTDKLIQKYPQNTFFQARQIEALLMSGRYDAAVEPIAKLKHEHRPYFKMIILLFEGILAESHNNNREQAKILYQQSIQIALTQKYTSSDYYGLAVWRLAKAYEAEKNWKKADEYFNKAEDNVEYSFAIEDVKRYKKSKR